MTTKHNEDWVVHPADVEHGDEEHPDAEADVRDQHIQLARLHTGIVSEHPEAHLLRAYTGNISHDLNHHIATSKRLGTDPTDGPYGMYHRGIQEVFKQAPPLTNDAHTYAGFTTDKLRRIGGGLMPGGTVHFPAYTSTSISPMIATGFTYQEDGPYDREHHVAHFHVPAGHKHALYVEPISRHSLEKELLLNADTHATYLGSTSHLLRRTIDADNLAHPKFARLNPTDDGYNYDHTSHVRIYHFQVHPKKD